MYPIWSEKKLFNDIYPIFEIRHFNFFSRKILNIEKTSLFLVRKASSSFFLIPWQKHD